MVSEEAGPFRYDIPTPKVKPSDRKGVHSWLYYYAAFSPKFVAAMLKLFCLEKRALLLDPFAGVGTTCVVAKQHDIDSIGVELNPIAYLVSSAKLAWNVDRNQALALLKQSESRMSVTEASPTALFTNWGSIAQPILQQAYALGSSILRSVQDPGARDLLLCSVVLSLDEVFEVQRGSNPVWLRNHTLRINSNKPLLAAVRHRVEIMLDDISQVRTDSTASSRILYEDSRCLKLNLQVDAVLTSPPYLNRLDYIVSHRLANEFLTALGYPTASSLSELRTAQIGSVKIADKAAPSESWGLTCNHILQTIVAHGSKAARSYYYPTIMRYFKDMYHSLRSIRQILKPGRPCCIVVQTSFFKEIEIPVSRIFGEMGESLGFDEATLLRREPVKTHMGLLDPDQRRRVAKKVLHEDVLLLR